MALPSEISLIPLPQTCTFHSSFFFFVFFLLLVLRQYCKLNEQMEERQYYSALKTLEQLEHTLLPPVKGYIFSDLLKKEVPRIRKSIQDQSIAELTVSYLSSCVLLTNVNPSQALSTLYSHLHLPFCQNVCYDSNRTFWPRFEKILSLLERLQCTRYRNLSADNQSKIKWLSTLGTEAYHSRA